MYYLLLSIIIFSAPKNFGMRLYQNSYSDNIKYFMVTKNFEVIASNKGSVK